MTQKIYSILSTGFCVHCNRISFRISIFFLLNRISNIMKQTKYYKKQNVLFSYFQIGTIYNIYKYILRINKGTAN